MPPGDLVGDLVVAGQPPDPARQPRIAGIEKVLGRRVVGASEPGHRVPWMFRVPRGYRAAQFEGLSLPGVSVQPVDDRELARAADRDITGAGQRAADPDGMLPGGLDQVERLAVGG